VKLNNPYEAHAYGCMIIRSLCIELYFSPGSSGSTETLPLSKIESIESRRHGTSFPRNLTRRLFGSMLGRIATLPSPAG
jgi:hypothetical protein